MKKLLFMFFALLSFGNIWAAEGDPVYVIPDVEVAKGGQGIIIVQLENADGKLVRGGQFDLIAPAGVTINYSDAEISSGQTNSKKFSVGSSQVTSWEGDGGQTRFRFVLSTIQQVYLFDGDAVEIPFTVTDDCEIGDEFPVQVTGSSASDGNPYPNISLENGGCPMDNFSFKIIIIDSTVTLDETETYEDFEPRAGVKVNVKRSIKANIWNTICLPFAMSAAQITEAFGEGAEVADFSGCGAVMVENEEGDDVLTGIHLNFQTVSEMNAHHPYLIKVKDPISYENGFSVDNVDILSIDDDDSDGGSIEVRYKRRIGSTNKTIKNYFNANYSPTESLGDEDNVVFLSKNRLYIAHGNSTLKGFRGYFVLGDLNAYIEESGILESGANISIMIDDVATDIQSVAIASNTNQGIYDLQGRKLNSKNVNTLQKGVYVVNGKKITVK